jgi:hypothetical protein
MRTALTTAPKPPLLKKICPDCLVPITVYLSSDSPLHQHGGKGPCLKIMGMNKLMRERVCRPTGRQSVPQLPSKPTHDANRPVLDPNIDPTLQKFDTRRSTILSPTPSRSPSPSLPPHPSSTEDDYDFGRAYSPIPLSEVDPDMKCPGVDLNNIHLQLTLTVLTYVILSFYISFLVH